MGINMWFSAAKNRLCFFRHGHCLTGSAGHFCLHFKNAAGEVIAVRSEIPVNRGDNTDYSC